MTSKFSIDNRELLQRISSGEAVVGIDFGNLIVRELAAFRMAAMDSEPVIVVGDDGGDALSYRRLIQSFEPGTKLYRHAQPAPAVPDAYVRDERGRMMLNGVCEPKIGFGTGWNACRAAMLQAGNHTEQLLDMADHSGDATKKAGNSPVIPDDVSIFEAAIEECKTCDSIDEHAWNHGVLAVIAKYESCHAAMLAAAPQLPGSEPATVPGKWIPVSERMPIEFEAVIAFDGDQVYGEAMYSSDDGFTIDGYEPCDRLNLQNVTHWMPLPAAQQEVR